MTLIIDRENDEVRDKDSGEVIETINGPPYHHPGDASKAVRKHFPSEDSAVSVQDLYWTLDVASGDIEWANPPEEL